MRTICLKALVFGVACVVAGGPGAALGQAKSASDYLKAPPKYSSPAVNNREVKFPTGIYDESADGWAQLRAAMEVARKDGRRVLVMWGENQCGFCAYLSDLLWHESPGIRALLDTEYVFVPIDISKSHTKHNDLARRYGATNEQRLADSPRLTVIDPVKDVGVGTIGKEMVKMPMSVEVVFDEKVILPFLEANRPGSQTIAEAMGPALKESSASGKPILVLFTQTAGECEECRKWEGWLQKAEVKEALEGAFAIASVDVSKTSGAAAMLERASGKSGVRAPAVLGLTSPAVVIERYPGSAEEGKALVAQLAGVSGTKLSDTQRSMLLQSLATVTTVTGIATNAKAGAIVDGHYIEGLSTWPADVLGKRVKVMGRLVHKQGDTGTEEAPSQSHEGVSQWLVGAKWEVIAD